MQTTAARTKVDRVTVAMVREAYERTGLHPARDCYRDDKGGACALYVVALMFDQQGPDDGEDERDFIQRILRLDPGYFNGFLLGFDEPEDVRLGIWHTSAYVLGFDDGQAVATKLLDRTHAKCDPPLAVFRGAAAS